MATTYSLIASSTLASTAQTFSFTAIPQTYTDLCLRYVARDNSAQISDRLQWTVNNDGGNNYAYQQMTGTGTAVSGQSGYSNGVLQVAASAAGTSTSASIYSNAEMYFSNYTYAGQKPIAHFNSVVNRSTTASDTSIVSNRYLVNTAISSIQIDLGAGNYFEAGSSFYLYGIKKA